MEKKSEWKTDVLDWWRELIENKGVCARLRRCAIPEDAALVAETFKVIRILPCWVTVEAAATIAGILSHLKIGSLSESESFGKKLGKKKNDREVFSETRFRQLLKSRTWNEFYTHLRRAIIILDGICNPISVIDIIIKWDYEQKHDFQSQPGKSLAFRLSSDYYLANIK